METISAVVIMLILIGGFAYCMAPPHWQTPLGFLLIAFGWMPVALVILAMLAMPAILIPAVFILGALLIGRNRRGV